MSDVNAWQEDVNGRFIEMAAGITKNYAIDWSDWIVSPDTLATAVWTLADGLTNAGQAIEGSVSQIHITTTVAGAYDCSVRITTGANPALSEKIPFRVIVA